MTGDEIDTVAAAIRGAMYQPTPAKDEWEKCRSMAIAAIAAYLVLGPK